MITTAKEQILAAFVVDNGKTAERFLKKVQAIDKADENVIIIDAAIAEKNRFGRVKIHQTTDRGGVRGGVRGGTIGVVVGTILLGPAGAVVGGAAGGILAGLHNRFHDIGVNDKFMKDVGKHIDRGMSILFVQYEGNWSHSIGAVEDAIKAEGALLLYSDLSPEKAAALQALTETAVEELGGAEVTADYEVAATPEAAAAEAAPIAETAPVVAAAAVAGNGQGADDLTQIKGVGPKSADALKAAGIDSYAKLASTSEPDLRQDLTAASASVPGNVNTWAMQASFAAKGDWVGMMAYAEKSEPRKHEPKPEPAAPAAAEDLTQLSGIGPKASQALAAAGITTYAALAAANEPQLRQALHDADMVPPGNIASWPMQATYAVKGDWAGLAKHNQKAAPAKAAAAAQVPAGPPDDLTKLSGIGPRIETLLNESGITTYEQLRHANVDQLRSSLAAAGALPPSALATWPTQAAYAVKGDWTGLATYNQSH